MDLADKYPPAEYFEDEEPTIKMVRPLFEDDRDTIPAPPPYPKTILPPPLHEERRYPGVGLLLALTTGLLFWGAVAWFVWGYYNSHNVSTPEAGVEVPR